MDSPDPPTPDRPFLFTNHPRLLGADEDEGPDLTEIDELHLEPIDTDRAHRPAETTDRVRQPVDPAELPERHPTQEHPTYSDDPLIGQIIAGHYRILERLAEGGMGVVYRARQVTMERDVAIKLIRQELITSEHVLLRFMNEAKAIGRLRHPHTLRLYEARRLKGSGQFVLITELLEGVSLYERIAEQGPIGMRTFFRLTEQIGGSLAEAHSAGIVHRDLKSANVFLDRIGQHDFVKVLDFGVAKLAEGHSRITQTGQLVGSPVCMSPEQATGQSVDHRSDIYALGILFYEMLAGAPPFSASNLVSTIHNHVYSETPHLRDCELPHEIPESIDELVFQMMAKAPGDRPQSVADVLERLEDIREGDWMSVPTHVGDDPATQISDDLPLPAVTHPLVEKTVEQTTETRSKVFGFAVGVVIIVALAGGVALGRAWSAIIPPSKRSAKFTPPPPEPPPAAKVPKTPVKRAPPGKTHRNRRRTPPK